MAAVRYLHTRMNTYQLTPENWQKENTTIQQILKNKGYKARISETFSITKKPKQDKDKKRVGEVHLCWKRTRAVTKAFKNTNVKITYSINNTLGKLLTIRHQQFKRKY